MQMINLIQKSKLYKALGEPIRLKIIDYLMNQNSCVCICELGKALKRDQSVIYRHIQILKDVNILKTSKESKYLMCCIKDKSRIKKILGD